MAPKLTSVAPACHGEAIVTIDLASPDRQEDDNDGARVEIPIPPAPDAESTSRRRRREI